MKSIPLLLSSANYSPEIVAPPLKDLLGTQFSWSSGGGALLLDPPLLGMEVVGLLFHWEANIADVGRDPCI